MKPILFNTEMVRAILDGEKAQTRRVIKWQRVHITDSKEKLLLKINPIKVGDILWVRETWARWKNFQGEEVFVYRADNNVHGIKWKPSIFMPKEAARIFLHVTDVRIERLQDISVEDIIAEGFPMERLTKNYGDKQLIEKAIEWFKNLWNSLAKEGYKWEDNPYVFVHEFEKVEKPC